MMGSTEDPTCPGTLMWAKLSVRGEMGKGLGGWYEELGKQEFPRNLSVSN